MSHDHDLDALDARGEAAGTDLRSRAAGRPVPAFDPHRGPDLTVALPPPARRGRSLAAAAAAVVLVAGGTVWWSARPERGTDTAEEVVTGEPRPYVATDLPAGLQLYGVADLEPEKGGGSIRLYGPDVRHPELGLVVAGPWPEGGLGDDATPVEVGGVTGYRLAVGGLGDANVALRMGSQAVVLVSSVLEPEALAAFLPSVEVDGLAASLAADAVPEGWTLLGDVADGLAGITPAGVQRGVGGAARSSIYVAGDLDSSDPDDGSMATVVSAAGGEREVYGAALALTEREDVTVQGHPAVVGRTAPTTGVRTEGWTVSWSPRPGEVVRVAGLGLDRDQVLAVAAGVQPAGAGEWRELLTQTQLGLLRPDLQGATIGEGTFEDGTRWILRTEVGQPGEDDQPDGVDLSVALDRSGSASYSAVGSSIGGSEEPPSGVRETQTVAYDGRQFIAGTIAPDVDTVEIRTADGEVVVQAAIVEGAGLRAFVAELPADGSLSLVALAADGAEVDARAVERPGNGGSLGASGESSSSGGNVGGEGTGEAVEECALVGESGGTTEECLPAPEPQVPGTGG